MSELLKRISEGIEELFPEIGDIKIHPDLELGEIPEWDSMSSVNFQIFIEQNFQVQIPQDLLVEETTIAEVISYIEDPSKMETAV